METPGRRGRDGMLTSAGLRMVGFCTRHPWPVIVIAAGAAVGFAPYSAPPFPLTPRTHQLLPHEMPWRHHRPAYREGFPPGHIPGVWARPPSGPWYELRVARADEWEARSARRAGGPHPDGAKPRFHRPGAWPRGDRRDQAGGG